MHTYSHNSARGHREEQPQVVALPIPPYLAAWHQQHAPPTARDLRGSWWLQNVDVQKMCFEKIKMCFLSISMCMIVYVVASRYPNIQMLACWHVDSISSWSFPSIRWNAWEHGSRAAKGGLQRATVANQTVDLFRGFSTVGAAQQVHQIPASTLMFEPHIILKIWCVQLGSRPV